MLVAIGEKIVALNTGIPRWYTPEFASTRSQAEAARKKRGPYGPDANVAVTIPAIGQASERTYVVTKGEDGELVFKSDYDPKTTGLDAFVRKFKMAAYDELSMVVQSGDSTSFVALPEADGFTCEPIEFRDTEGGKKWRRVLEEAEFTSSALQPCDVILVAISKGCTGEDSIHSFAKAMSYRRGLKKNALTSDSSNWTCEDGEYTITSEGESAMAELLREHSGLQEAIDAVPEEEGGGEEANDGFDTSALKAADVMILGIHAGANEQQELKTFVSSFDPERKMAACFGESAPSRYGDLWTCIGRGSESVYALTEDGQSQVAHLTSEHGDALSEAVKMAMVVEEEEDDEVAASSLSCKHCGKVYAYAKALERHEASCTGETPSAKVGKTMTVPPTKPTSPASVASSSTKASKALAAAASAAAVVLEASVVSLDSHTQEVLATRESVISEARRKRKFELWTKLSVGISEDDDDGQVRIMKQARVQAESEHPFDSATIELRTAYDDVQKARAELVARESALASIVGRLEGAPSSSKRAKRN